MKTKNLIDISELNRDDIINILKYADELKKQNEDFLSGKNIGLIFEKNSTRTRLSFEAAAHRIGANLFRLV